MTGRRISLTFAWYDLWLGAYVDRKNRVLYVCPLPTLLITIPLRRRPHRTVEEGDLLIFGAGTAARYSVDQGHTWHDPAPPPSYLCNCGESFPSHLARTAHAASCPTMEVPGG